MIKYGLLRAIRSSHLHLLRNASTKPFYVTSPIFYVNGKPHLGHLYSMLLCDTRNRWEKLNPGRSSYFLTGTDEHGLKIQAAAESQGLHPKELVDTVSRNFITLAEKLDLKYDRFIRTTDQDHVETVQEFWRIMSAKGLIYEGKHSGWYSISDETFYPETQIERVIDSEGRHKMISKETRNEVIKLEEINYRFKLSQFQDKLISFLESNPGFIEPKSKYRELLAELKTTSLPDLSVSRPSSRLTWGIDVPGDPSQKIYVWFDALINYITAAGFPGKFHPNGTGVLVTPDDAIWPATHVIGKDILRFHCIYWPIFLIAAGIELPKQVIVHSHWLSDSFKMSKSLGNVVDPIETFEYYGQDSLRFFLAEYSNIETDCNFNEQNFYYTRETLIGKYANLMTRCGGKSFNIKKSVELYKEGMYNNIDQILHESNLSHVNSKDLINQVETYTHSLNNLFDRMNSKVMKFDLMKGIQEWWQVVEQANQIFQLGEPWAYSKFLKGSDLGEDNKKNYYLLQNYFVFLASEGCRICSILINPIIPSLSTSILDRLSVADSHRNADFCKIGQDLSYGDNANSKNHKIPIERIPIRSKKE
ncbi:uncharacterized protein PRCAT00000328001 [Priceomyces carsonii]|uniref:uncharacterized protein n=1 Tax=Priceomyces carsonii TaxID=28549 RepID=UPI002ED99F03|nr:unnamed protein product [Priceomyces carsonii]